MNFFLKRYAQLGETFDPEEIELKRSLRVNTVKAGAHDVLVRLKSKKVKLEKIPFLTDGYFYTSEFSLGSTPEYLQGYYYLQEAASQVAAQVLNPSSEDAVLDMSAAPGGKTTQMAAMMKNQGVIIALDNEVHRLESLRNNLERLSVSNVITYKKDARYVDDLNLYFDKVLLDAPCSGNFADDRNWFENRNITGVKDRSKIQKALLRSAYKVLKPGGTLVYSTCTLEPEENEENVTWILNEYDDIRLETIDIDAGSPGLSEAFGEVYHKDISKVKRFWPHKSGTQGFFIAKIVKNS